MARAILAACFAATCLAGALSGQAAPAVPAPAVLTRQVFAAESSFAATMASRDSIAFATFVASDAIFFGEKSVLRGKSAVVDGWRALLTHADGPAAATFRP